MVRRILVTGHTGFIGRALVRRLREHYPNAEIAGLARSASDANCEHKVDRLFSADLTSPQQISEAVSDACPDSVFHLASRRTGDLRELLESNVLGTDHLLRSLRGLGRPARVVVVGSSAEIGYPARTPLPWDEGCPCEPIDSYGLSKLAQAAVARTAHRAYGQDVVRVRLFNVIGPGSPDSVLAGRCASQLEEVARGTRPQILQFGDLGTRRDYTDVRDVSRALVLALEGGESGDLYHVGSGVSVSGRDLVQMMISAARGCTGDVSWREEQAGEPLVPTQAADATRARVTIGWCPEFNLEQSVRDTWNAVLQAAEL